MKTRNRKFNTDEIDGDSGNYCWPVTLDKSGRGYVGITQKSDGECHRVLLSPSQVKALLKFVGR